MRRISRRDVLKSSLLVPVVAAATAHGITVNPAVTSQPSESVPRAGQDAAVSSSALPGAGRERLLLDFGWRFHFGNANDPTKDFGFGSGESGNFQKTGDFLAASSVSFDDGAWRALNLPHDWAIELPFTNDPALRSKGFYPLGRDYPASSVGWYRRVFDLPAEDAAKRITVEFDGAYRETMVVCNGFYVGRHSGGYDPFSFDLTDFLNPGRANVLLVRVDATLSDGWFYEGAGIYRHVWLVKTHPVHVKKWGTFASSKVSNGNAAVSVRTEISNDATSPQTARVTSTIFDPSGNAVGKATTAPTVIAGGQENTFTQQIKVQRPLLWSLEERNMYKLVTEISVGGAVVDRYETPFGIRTVSFDPQRGLFLNGKHVKVKGTCNHQDHAGIGAALPDAVQYYRVRKLQEMGCNALRTSHNPPTPELLDACDRLGMLVFDETRMMSSNPEGLSQFANLVRRDRNRPSVFMWSMGNEERVANAPRGVAILSAMKALATDLDGTRPVSIAPTGAIGAGGLAECDVMGYNYMDPQALAYHKAHPDKPVIGTETVSAVGTRGVYITDFEKGYVGSYDPYTTTGRASAAGWWKFCNAQPWLAGGFIWTGFDYRGEPSPDDWPNISSQYGILDTCGFPKDSFYYYQSWWTSRPVLHLFPHWNWPGLEGKEIAVWVYSNLDRVELFQDGLSLGAKDVPKDSHVAWVAKYAAGALEARGYKGGKLILTTRRETTGSPAKLVMTCDRREISADGEDVGMFAVAVQDGRGRVVPITDNVVSFRVTGQGKLIGLGNGDPTDQTSDKGTARKAFSGLCMALIQSSKQAGSITVEASSPGLAPAAVTIRTNEVRLRPQVAIWERKVPAGSGLTGLWRPLPAAPASGSLAWFVGNGNTLFILSQAGSELTGTLEGEGGYFGSDEPIPIQEGRVEGNNLFFKAGNSSYSGTVQGGQLQLQRVIHLPAWVKAFLKKPQASGPQLAVGPPPDGSDPSFNPNFPIPASIPVVLHRVER